MKHVQLAAIVFSIILFLSGCGTTTKFVYPSNMRNLTKISDKPIYNKSIVVLPFDDYRSDDNEASTMFLYWIPLFPYGYVSYDRPEAADRFVSIDSYDCNVSEDLAKAAATSLRYSNLFKSAYFSFGDTKEADFILKGEVYSYYYKGREFSYGLSFVGSLFWFLGAPAGTSTNEISCRVTLYKKGSDQAIWQYRFEKDDYYVQWIYGRMGWDTRLFTRIYEQAMNKAVLSLAKKLKGNPDLLDQKSF